MNYKASMIVGYLKKYFDGLLFYKEIEKKFQN